MISVRSLASRAFTASYVNSLHTLSAAQAMKKTQFPPRPKISEEDIEEVFIKGGGKGGQKINKTNSKVQLKHIPTGIVINSQFSRSREQNRRKARELLALKIEELTAPEGQSRNEIIAKYKQQKARKKKSKSKKKYRDREEAQRAAALEGKTLEEFEEGEMDNLDETGLEKPDLVNSDRVLSEQGKSEPADTDNQSTNNDTKI